VTPGKDVFCHVDLAQRTNGSGGLVVGDIVAYDLDFTDSQDPRVANGFWKVRDKKWLRFFRISNFQEEIRLIFILTELLK
jgi:hypothetical protein